VTRRDGIRGQGFDKLSAIVDAAANHRKRIDAARRRPHICRPHYFLQTRRPADGRHGGREGHRQIVQTAKDPKADAGQKQAESRP
jgi:hypothetical protein